MADFLAFLQQYEIWIYLILGGVALVYLQKTLKASHDYRNALFGLEREKARRVYRSALSVLLLSVLLAVANLALVSFVWPNLPASGLPTPTMDIGAQPTATLPVAVEPQLTQTGVVVPTVAIAEGCLPGQIEWIFPTAGAEVQETVMLQGIVNVANLGFFKYEYGQPGLDNWLPIAAGNAPTSTEAPDFGVWNTSQLIPGDYLLRLVVYDNQNNPFPACIVPVRVLAPPE